MRLGARPDTVIEWLILKLNLAPTPLADTQLAFQFARIIMAATKAGLFETELAGPEVAQAIQLAIEYDPPPPFDPLRLSRWTRPTSSLVSAFGSNADILVARPYFRV